MAQQYEKKRYKRDFASVTPLRPAISNFALGKGSEFPDPNYREQWYLVSFLSTCPSSIFFFLLGYYQGRHTPYHTHAGRRAPFGVAVIFVFHGHHAMPKGPDRIELIEVGD